MMIKEAPRPGTSPRRPAVSEAAAGPVASRDRRGSTAARQALLRQLNERAVFEAIREHGMATWADLTRRFDVSSATISKAVANLLKGRLLEEVDASQDHLVRGLGPRFD